MPGFAFISLSASADKEQQVVPGEASQLRDIYLI
jgi:hypothetical protein